MICHRCHREVALKNESRLPRGWKRLDGQPTCGACVDALYALRAVTVPVARPEGMTWAELRAALQHHWRLMSQCATWMMRELYARDVQRGGQDKLPAMQRVYLYPEARAKFPAIEPTTISALEQQMQAKYRNARYGVVWTLDQQLPTIRYPQPIIVPAANWSVEIDDTARKDIWLSVRLEGERIKLRLRGGGDFRRQRRDIEQIVSGSAIKGELAIYRKRAVGTDRAGRNGQSSSAIGTERGEGGQRVKYDVMVKLVARFPRVQQTRSGTLYARTDTDSLLVALNAKDERLWIVHADHVRRWCAEHERRLHRWADDQKAEVRPGKPPFHERRSAAATKFRNRLHSFQQQVAAQLVGYAVRRRFASIQYDDSQRGYLSRFDWSGLQNCIAQKCAAEGIELILVTDASGAAAKESRQPLATEET